MSRDKFDIREDKNERNKKEKKLKSQRTQVCKFKKPGNNDAERIDRQLIFNGSNQAERIVDNERQNNQAYRRIDNERQNNQGYTTSWRKQKLTTHGPKAMEFRLQIS